MDHPVQRSWFNLVPPTIFRKEKHINDIVNVVQHCNRFCILLQQHNHATQLKLNSFVCRFLFRTTTDGSGGGGGCGSDELAERICLMQPDRFLRGLFGEQWSPRRRICLCLLNLARSPRSIGLCRVAV